MSARGTPRIYLSYTKRMKTTPTTILLALLTGLMLFTTGCRKDRISYVEMISREKKEIAAFMDKEGIRVRKNFPAEVVTPEKEFVEVEDGLYIRVINKGVGAPKSGETVISSRFNFHSISNRSKIDLKLYGPTSAGTFPLPFVYNENNEVLVLSPKADPNERNNQSLLCIALVEAAKHVGDGAELQIITSFRYGPAALSREGIPLFFDIVHFEYR